MWLAGAAALLSVEAAGAHHSFATHYLMDRSMEITGVVTEASLRNPYSFFTLQVATEDGIVEWEVEAHAVPLLRRIGIDRETIQPGDTITVVGPSPRGARRVTFGSRITLADGRQFSLLGGGLAANLTRYSAESVDALAAGNILQRMSGRWGVITPPGTQVIGETPLPLNEAGRAQKRLVERYTVSDDRTTLVLDYTLEDPVYLSEPFTARVEWDRLRDDAPIYDFDCDADIATRSTLNAVPL